MISRVIDLMRCCPLRGRRHEAGPFPNFSLIRGISKMKLIQSVVASAALLAGMAASSANAYVAFLRTDLTPYAKLESYPSLGELASNSNGALASNITPSIPVTQSMFTDGTYFYKIAANAQGDAGQYNNLIIRYQSLSDLCKDVNGETFNMNGYGMYYDDEVVADNLTGRYIRTTRYFPDSPVTVGAYVYGSFADLVNNNYSYAGGFSNQTVAFDCQFWAWNGKYYRTNVTGPTGTSTVTGFNIYNSSEDLYNGVVAQTVACTATYAGTMRFMALDSSLIPPPSCIADLNGDGIVNGADLGILLGAWGLCP